MSYTVKRQCTWCGVRYTYEGGEPDLHDCDDTPPAQWERVRTAVREAPRDSKRS